MGGGDGAKHQALVFALTVLPVGPARIREVRRCDVCVAGSASRFCCLGEALAEAFVF